MKGKREEMIYEVSEQVNNKSTRSSKVHLLRSRSYLHDGPSLRTSSNVGHSQLVAVKNLEGEGDELTAKNN